MNDETKNAGPKEKVYSESEIVAKLKEELPHWRYENGWIRRKYKTHGWKSTLMVINTSDTWPKPPGIILISRLLMHGWRSYYRIMPQRASPTRISSLPKRSKASFSGNRAKRRDRWKERRNLTSASPMLSTTIDRMIFAW